MTLPADEATYAERPRPLRTRHIVGFIVCASAPLTVVAGGLPTVYGVTALRAVPLVYLGIGLLVMIFSSGYAAMSHHVASSGAFYAYVARGLGPITGVGAAFVAVIAYNGMQVSIYGLFGAHASALMAGWGWGEVPWAIPALVMVIGIGVLGSMRVEASAAVLGVMLAVECLVVFVFDVGALTHASPDGVSVAAWSPTALVGGSLIAAVCLVISSFMGVESGALFAEETVNPRRTIARATYLAVAGISVFYAVAAWAYSVATGPSAVVAASKEHGPQLMFVLLGDSVGPRAAAFASLLYLTSLFAALLSFHHAVSRYLYALGREGVLPRALAKVNEETGAPVVGALVQTVIAFTMVVVFTAAELDPVLNLLVWISSLGTLGVILLMALTSAAAIGFFRHRVTGETLWARRIAPGIAAALFGVIFLVVATNFDVLLGDSTTPLRWILPGLVVGFLAAGLGWGWWLRTHRPDIYRRIGHGDQRPAPSTGVAGFSTT